MPDAVACAAYHYLSNSVGGVTVEFMRESDRKAWVNFVPPRWIYPGASICGCRARYRAPSCAAGMRRTACRLATRGSGFLCCTAQTRMGEHRLSGFSGAGPRIRPEERLQFRPGSWPALRRGSTRETAGRGLAARAAREGRAQLRHGIHPPGVAASGEIFGPPRRPSWACHGAAGRRPTLQGDGGPPRHRGRGGAQRSPTSWCGLAAGEGDVATVAREGEAGLVRRADWRPMRGLGTCRPPCSRLEWATGRCARRARPLPGSLSRSPALTGGTKRSSGAFVGERPDLLSSSS